MPQDPAAATPNQIFPGLHYSDGTAQRPLLGKLYLLSFRSPNISNLCASHDGYRRSEFPLTCAGETLAATITDQKHDADD